MLKIKKIQAFTLNEMLVVLLLTAIVVGMAFAVLQLVQQQMNGINKNYEHNSEFNLLQQSLWMDFNQSDGIWFDDKTQELFLANEIREITYRINENQIVKGLDTFDIALKNQQFFFLGKERESGEVDALDFMTTKETGSKRLFVYKQNSATSYVNE